MSATATPARPLMELEESYRCINESCDAAIPRHHVFINYDRQSVRRTRRAVKAHCPHCRQVYQVKQRLDGGIWRNEGSVETLAGAAREGVLARVAHLRGDVQRAVDA
ncbi:MAG: hypothetical protein WBD40_01340 [Tepidisphaeraceae bacterium]